MCLAVYLGTDSAMPEINWEISKPAFNVHREINRPNLRARIGKENLYYVGSDEHCGCGFLLVGLNEEDKEWLEKKKNYEALGQYLKTNLNDENAKIFACWEGDQEKEPINEVEINLDQIENGEIEFEELFQYGIRIQK